MHCSVEPVADPDLVFDVDFNGTTYNVFVKHRPHLIRFLEAVYDKFEVTVFTASQVRVCATPPPPPSLSLVDHSCRCSACTLRSC